MIDDHLYINLEKFVDVTEFDSLHLEICRGIATARHLARNGLHTINPGTINPDSHNCKIKPVYDAYAEWNLLPDTDLLKIAGKDLNHNQLTTYLKYAFGGYDLYSLYILFDDNKVVDEISSHFPNLTKWILKFLSNNTVTNISGVTLFVLDAGGIPWEHKDPEHEVIGNIAQFIHIKTDLDRPFYMVDPKTKERIYMNTRVAWWDEADWHGGEAINRPTYTLRINGWFSDEFKKIIGI